MFKKNQLHRETLFIHTNQIQASERRRLFSCCKLPCQKHGLSFLTTVSYLLCSHTAWQAGHRERLQTTLLCLKREFKKHALQLPSLEGQMAEAGICLCTDELALRDGNIFRWRVSKWERCLLKTASVTHQLCLAESQGKVSAPETRKSS